MTTVIVVFKSTDVCIVCHFCLLNCSRMHIMLFCRPGWCRTWVQYCWRYGQCGSQWQYWHLHHETNWGWSSVVRWPTAVSRSSNYLSALQHTLVVYCTASIRNSSVVVRCQLCCQQVADLNPGQAVARQWLPIICRYLPGFYTNTNLYCLVATCPDSGQVATKQHKLVPVLV